MYEKCSVLLSKRVTPDPSHAFACFFFVSSNEPPKVEQCMTSTILVNSVSSSPD